MDAEKISKNVNMLTSVYFDYISSLVLERTVLYTNSCVTEHRTCGIIVIIVMKKIKSLSIYCALYRHLHILFSPQL